MIFNSRDWALTDQFFADSIRLTGLRNPFLPGITPLRPNREWNPRRSLIIYSAKYCLENLEVLSLHRMHRLPKECENFPKPIICSGSSIGEFEAKDLKFSLLLLLVCTDCLLLQPFGYNFTIFSFSFFLPTVRGFIPNPTVLGFSPLEKGWTQTLLF